MAVSSERTEFDEVARVVLYRVRVADGDTITVLDASKTQRKIRLQGIDAPEKGQAYGDAAGRYLSGLVAGRDVRVKWAKRERLPNNSIQPSRLMVN